MAWDLRGALLKKEERESARLADFDFRLRARTMRLLAPLVDPQLAPDALAREIATGADAHVLDKVAERYPARAGELRGLHASCRSEARRQLVEELGDPSPHRLA